MFQMLTAAAQLASANREKKLHVFKQWSSDEVRFHTDLFTPLINLRGLKYKKKNKTKKQQQKAE